MSRGKIVDEIRGDELGERRIVEAIVGSRAGAATRRRSDESELASARSSGSVRGVVPLVLMTTLILAVGAYTAVRQDAFLTELQPQQPPARDDAARARLRSARRARCSSAASTSPSPR